MTKRLYTILVPLFLVVIVIFIIDQEIKYLVMTKAMKIYSLSQPMLYHKVLDIYKSSCINLRLVFNDGVAFSMLAFLHGYLKWMQLILIIFALFYVIKLNKKYFVLPTGLIIGAGLSNIFDRFLHGGVVDYVYWHCGFNFAIFNFADVMIDVGIGWILLLNFFPTLFKRN